MPNTWDIGDEPRLKVTLTDSSGVATDPTAVIIAVKKPTGVILSYAYSAGFSSQGAWNASTNSPALANGTGTAGHYYTISVAGIQVFGDTSYAFAIGDWVYYNGKVWRQAKNVQSTGLTKESTGIYYVDQYLELSGQWWYGVDSVGSRAASEDYFFVRSREV